MRQAARESGRTFAHLERPISGNQYAARTSKGQIVVSLTAKQFLAVWDCGGAFEVDQNGEFVTAIMP